VLLFPTLLDGKISFWRVFGRLIGKQVAIFFNGKRELE
jgi:hypothetical protein